ncbi:hypothetical protein AVU39_gp34 [Sulfolobus monocaudavirus SMV2]|uniref:hypothetical protein n=1 Tax=Sulfolobus monocaudavirus SMV2 TaxID=1580591 RepID=UPI0006D30215|nr:hypothetical protein AVU39_gp34 [Sulfolobus monocaudavirus SMV2]AIZ11368.1 hypothetical protein [Sulfolobus monocaudavirus SMV2]
MRDLTDEEILKIMCSIVPIYIEGQRHTVIMYLTGWLYKAGISYRSAKKLVKLICETFNDGECDDRIYTLDRTYGYRGTQPQKYKLKTKSGIYELLVEALKDEEKAKRIIRKLENILSYRPKSVTLFDVFPKKQSEVNMNENI